MTCVGCLVLIKKDTFPPQYWLGWTPKKEELILQLTLTSPNPVTLLWSQPGDEQDEEDLAYPYIRYWLADTDWFELPQSAVDEICAISSIIITTEEVEGDA